MGAVTPTPATLPRLSILSAFAEKRRDLPASDREPD